MHKLNLQQQIQVSAILYAADKKPSFRADSFIRTDTEYCEFIYEQYKIQMLQTNRLRVYRMYNIHNQLFHKAVEYWV